MTPESRYRVLLNEDWELEDLYDFPHAYSQCYSFIYCLDSEVSPRDRERIDNALQEYPWRGGYSYVNIYTVFKHQVPYEDRPKVKSIRKESPGWLDLILNNNVAYHLAGAVSTLSAAAVGATAAYKKSHGFVLSVNAARRRAGIERMAASAAEMKSFNALCTELAKSLGFKSLAALHEHTGNPEISLKLLMAHYRRMMVLVDFTNDRKVMLTGPQTKK
jgi:hypothetical protein